MLTFETGECRMQDNAFDPNSNSIEIPGLTCTAVLNSTAQNQYPRPPNKPNWNRKCGDCILRQVLRSDTIKWTNDNANNQSSKHADKVDFTERTSPNRKIISFTAVCKKVDMFFLVLPTKLNYFNLFNTIKMGKSTWSNTKAKLFACQMAICLWRL